MSNFNYTGSIRTQPPQRTGVLTGLFSPTSSNQEDVMRSMESTNMAAYNAAADRADSDYALANQRAQQTAALAGLDSLVQDRDRAQAYDNSALRGYLGAVSPIFSAMMR